jgi:hypothetical protein
MTAVVLAHSVPVNSQLRFRAANLRSKPWYFSVIRKKGSVFLSLFWFLNVFSGFNKPRPA